MNYGFWDTLRNKKPFFALAPMADVTDISFRQTVITYSRKGKNGGGPDVLWTEFVSADGLILGGEHILKYDLSFEENERPIIAQLFGSNTETMEKAATYVAKLGFDGIDINMGCPDKSIEKQGAGACMIKHPPKAAEIIHAVKMGIQLAGKNIPVSVKTRIGYHTSEVESWIVFLLKQDIAALTIHARTRKDLSKVPARWEFVKRVVELRDALAPNTLIIGNGDVGDIADGKEKWRMSGCDGIMVGRAALGNPWIFDEESVTRSYAMSIPHFIARFLPSKLIKSIKGIHKYTVIKKTKEERIEALLFHAKLFDEKLSQHKNFIRIKKHIKAYLNGFPGAKELREKVFEKATDFNTLKEVLTDIDKHSI